MKRLLFFFLLPTLAMLMSCESGSNGPAGGGSGFLDSTYRSANYRAAMDSIHHGSGIAEDEFDLLQRFMRNYRDSIVGAPTYRSLLECATAIQKMEAGLSMKVASMGLYKNQKVVEIRIVLAIQNNLSMAVGRMRGNIGWADEKGNILSKTPAFSVLGPIGPGQSTADLRLEYGLYLATGNELNDPRLQAARDTIEMIEEIAKRKDLNALKLQVHDLQLANGKTPAQYWMMASAARTALQDQQDIKTADRIQMVKWAEQNTIWIDRLQASNSPYSLMISPILTAKVEASHGKYLILDRISKVRGFFIGQKKLYEANVNDATQGKRLVLSEVINFWEWPMEIRIYERI